MDRGCVDRPAAEQGAGQVSFKIFRGLLGSSRPLLLVLTHTVAVQRLAPSAIKIWFAGVLL